MLSRSGDRGMRTTRAALLDPEGDVPEILPHPVTPRIVTDLSAGTHLCACLLAVAI